MPGKRPRRWPQYMRVRRRLLSLLAAGAGVILAAGAVYFGRTPPENTPLSPAAPALIAPAGAPAIIPVGPRENLPAGAPEAYGFWSFAQPVPNVLSRSGQPLGDEFAWLAETGWLIGRGATRRAAISVNTCRART